MKLLIHTFANLKEHFSEKFELEVDALETVKHLKDELVKIKPETALLLNSCRFAVDEMFVDDSTKLNERTTIYIIPPSSGG